MTYNFPIYIWGQLVVVPKGDHLCINHCVLGQSWVTWEVQCTIPSLPHLYWDCRLHLFKRKFLAFPFSSHFIFKEKRVVLNPWVRDHTLDCGRMGLSAQSQPVTWRRKQGHSNWRTRGCCWSLPHTWKHWQFHLERSRGRRAAPRVSPCQPLYCWFC